MESIFLGGNISENPPQADSQSQQKFIPFLIEFFVAGQYK